MRNLLLILVLFLFSPYLHGQDLNRFDPSNKEVLIDSLKNMSILRPDQSIRLAHEILENYVPGEIKKK